MNTRTDRRGDQHTLPVAPDPAADLAVAETGLEDAAAALAGTWAALRQAGRDDLAGPLVGILARLRGYRVEVGEALAEAREVEGKAPADWFLAN